MKHIIGMMVAAGICMSTVHAMEQGQLSQPQAYTYQEMSIFAHPGADSIVISPDGNTLLTGSVYDESVMLKSLTTKENPRYISLFAIGVKAFSSDSKKAAIARSNNGSNEGGFTILDIEKGEKRKQTLLEKFQCVALKFAPGDQKVIATDSVELKIVNVYTGNVEHEIKPTSWIEACFLQGNTVMAVCANGLAKRVDLATYTDLPDIKYQSDSIKGIPGSWGSTTALSNNTMAIVGDDNSVGMYDAKTGDEIPTFLPQEFSDNVVEAIALSSEGKTLGLGFDNGGVCLLDAATAKLKHALSSARRTSIKSITFSPNNRSILIVPHNGPAVIYDVETGKKALAFEGDATSGAFSPNGDFAVVTSRDQRGVVMIAKRVIAHSAQLSKNSQSSRSSQSSDSSCVIY